METYFMLILLGLLVGSFVTAVSYRIPRSLGFVTGRSFCDFCKKELRWYDNIPLFSFLLYRGFSRCCNIKISLRYPVIELVSVVAAIGIYIIFGAKLFILYYLLFIVSLIIFVIDLEHQIIPDGLSWLIIVLFFFNPNFTMFPSLFAGFFFGFLILLLNIVTGGRGMGLGDAKLAIGIGMWLGLINGFTWLMLSFLTGGVVASILLISGKAKMKTKIAFGPFLILAFWLTLITNILI